MPALRDFSTLLIAHPRWTALVLGGLAACGFQPLALWPLTLLAIAGLIELIARAASWKQAALLGWLFGLGHFTVGNTWIATAFTYQANMPAWLGWIAVVLLSFYLAVYPAMAALGAWLIGQRSERSLVTGFAAAWIVTEWLRSWVFTGFAWNPLGVILLGSYDSQGLAWIAVWTGTYGLSGLVVLIGGLIRNWPLVIGRVPKEQRRTAAIPAIVTIILIAGGMVIPASYLPPPHGTLPFTLVQPDIRQQDLDDRAQWAGAFVKIARMSQPQTGSTMRLVLWPESGVPFYLADGYPREFYFVSDYEADPAVVRRRIGEAMGPSGLLLTGAVNLELRAGEVAGARNVITAIDGQGRIHGNYAKAHLVPYGEYLPMRPLLEPLGLSRLVPGSIDFWPGPGPRTLDLGPWGKAGMQICYEIVFSGQVVDRDHRPDYLFNPSNDGWFGAWGPPQHLAQARMRAIEEGLPVLRATTTGISAVIDADGVVRQHVARHVAGRLDGVIPPAHAPTLFARAGNMLPLGWAVFLLALSLVATRRRQE